ncbi:hypothetical protein F0P96_03300 [Hymenobacter busanensis]|uniref:Uncharacterized protein n=1 Tax=Hymenobacter busanensis TaxID=2607656 RepID=A0A7L4ZWL2_9BACT|nr:hypothetical protein [Hymenobacter busanensis]KAA9339653.1 hypothetical protein F0P96_03300 [Hymenobacter busanensis]QHJ06592.1 hypothetical protein GUY19_04450 [Hymenobacter busanensis]
MRTVRLLLVFVLTVLLLPASYAQKSKAKPKTTTLKAGTLVVLETANPLSSKDAQVGQSVSLRVKYDVVIGGRTVVKAGSAGSAQVVSAEQRKGMGKEGSLSIRPTVVQAVDGQMIPLTGTGVGQSGDDAKGGAIALAVVVSPLFLLKKGKDAVIPAGYEMQATVASETIIE